MLYIPIFSPVETPHNLHQTATPILLLLVEKQYHPLTTLLPPYITLADIEHSLHHTIMKLICTFYNPTYLVQWLRPKDRVPGSNRKFHTLYRDKLMIPGTGNDKYF